MSISKKERGKEEFSKAELNIISSFFPLLDEIKTTKDIESITRYSHERVHTLLTLLEKKGLVIKRDLGNVNVFRVNKSASELFFIWVYYLERLKKEHSIDRILMEDLLKIIDCHKFGCLSVAAFNNSFKYKGKESKFLFLIHSLRQSDLQSGKLSQELKDFLDSFPESNVNIDDVLLISSDDFAELRSSNQDIYQKMLESSIVFGGVENYYIHAYNGGHRKHA